MGLTVGIDLGTTNSVVAIQRRGIVETVLIDGGMTVPSVVSFREDGTTLVGKAAKARQIVDHDSTVGSAKRHMGERDFTYSIRRKIYRPQDIAAIVLKKLVEGASSTLGERVTDAVITVPAYFTDAQREDTRRAAEQAGITVLRLIPEPTAAAIAYGAGKGKDQTLLVYDLGGGTFDVSILRVIGDQFEVKAVGGDNFLGGDDFDMAIVNWAKGQFSLKTGISIDSLSGTAKDRALQRLKDAAEAAKIELGSALSATIELPDLASGLSLTLELERSQFESLTADLIQRTIKAVNSTLNDAGLTVDDIDRVLLVGGSTKNPLVRQAITKSLKDPYTADRVDEIVAHGAAMLAASLNLPIPTIRVQDVTAYAFGVGMLGDDDELHFVTMIPRQTPYPVSNVGVIGQTNHPMQTSVRVSVHRYSGSGNPNGALLMENESDSWGQDMTALGRLEMPVSRPSRERIGVAAIIALDADGILDLTAVEISPPDEVLPHLLRAIDAGGVLDGAGVNALLKPGRFPTTSVRLQVDD